VNPLNIYVTGYFLTRIFHPNIASNGEICVNTLKKDWNPSLGLRHVLTVSSIGTLIWSNPSTFIFTSYLVLLIFWACWYQVVRCLLIEPFPESALNEQAGKMLLENYEEYARHARWAIPYLTNQIPWQSLLVRTDLIVDLIRLCGTFATIIMKMPIFSVLRDHNFLKLLVHKLF